MTSLGISTGSLTAAPNPATPAQQITFTARFSPPDNSVAGAPSGTASFVAQQTLGFAPLQLDVSSARFVPSQTTTIVSGYQVGVVKGLGARVRPAPADQPYGSLNQEFVPHIVDFNKDGIPDLLLFDQYRGTLHLYLGSAPGGSFYDAGTLDTPDCTVADAAVGDLNGDGYPDVVYLCGSSTQVYVGLSVNGESLGQVTQVINNNSNSTQVALGDFNHDGKLDLIAPGKINGSTNGFQVFLGNGQGGFGSNATNADGQASQLLISQFGAGISLKIADFNNDGYPDFAIENYSIGGLPVAINIFQNNNGIFAASPSATLPTPSYGDTFYIAPQTRGGFPYVFYKDGSNIYFAINNGTSAISFFGTQDFFSVPNLSSFSVGDYDGDGLLDVAAYDGSRVTAYFGLSYAASTTLTAPLSNSVLLSSLDQNGDGYADLLTIIPPSPYTNGRLQTLITSGSAVATFNAGAFPVGTTQVTASYRGTVGLSEAFASTSVQVNALTPSVFFPQPASIVYGTALSSAQLQATASYNGTPVAGTFTFSQAMGTILHAGTQTLSVTFVPSDPTYTTAQASTTILVTRASPVPFLTWATPSSISYGTALSNTQLNASSGTLQGTFMYSPAAGAVLSAGTQTLNATFTPADTQDYVDGAITTRLVVSSTQSSIIWSTPASITYGTALSGTQLNATVAGNIPGTFIYSPAQGTILSAGTQTLGVVFTPSDSVNYQTVRATTTLIVNKATPGLTFGMLPAITYGTPLDAAQMNAAVTVAGNIPGTLTFSPLARTVLNAGTQQLSVTFTPTDAANYQPAAASTLLTVNQAKPRLTWAAPGAITYGTPLSSAQLNAVVAGNLPGTINYMPALGTVLPVGAQPLIATFTPTDARDYQTATASTTLVVNKVNSAITWATPAPIVYGTALSSAQLNASINGGLAGTLTYSPAAGTVLTAGTQMLSVTFTPADTVSTLPATANVFLTVSKATPVITWTAPSNVYLGSTLTSTQLNAAATGVTGSPLPGTFVYTPPAGSTVTASTTALSVTFTPNDLLNYSVTSQTLPLSAQTAVVTAVSPSTVSLGSTATSITVTGAGFAPDATIQVNGTSLPTTVVNSTTLTAVLPASSTQNVKSLPVLVVEPAESQTSAVMNLPVVAPPVNFAFSAPPSSASADQPKLNLTLSNPYPVDLTGVLTLTFTPAPGSVDDPAIRFSTGMGNGRSALFIVPANSTVTPNIALQTGTVLGRIQVTLALSAGGAVITPASIQPISITPTAAPPVLTAVTSSVNGSVLTVSVAGYSNTRDLTQANFHLTATGGPGLSNPDISVPVTNLFTTWYSSTNSTQYGSTFLYTQTFNLSNDFTGISKVNVTLVNSVGTSQTASTP